MWASRQTSLNARCACTRHNTHKAGVQSTGLTYLQRLLLNYYPCANLSCA
jgi:hypothetical protein